jgi:tetratricopeptide (TPR) repeat protein
VYEQGWFPDGSPFFTMKLVEGHTLAALLRDRPDPGHDLSRMLAVFGRVCEAMAYAHARGVIHRDLKPANVMVGAFGEVQVMDWGFAKILITGTGPLDTDPHEAGDGPPVREGSDDDPHGGTAGGALMGTPAYMPPEQARGDIALVDPRADVFALGAMLCEILTGRPPYSGESSEDVVRNAANANLAEAYTRLDACGADQDVRDLARRCLAAERTDRPADAGVVAREIEAYQVSVAERLRQAQVERAGAEARVREAAAKSRAERRARLALLGLAAALLIGTAAASVLAWMAIRAHRDAVAAAGTEAAAKREAETRQAEAQAVLKFVKTHILAAARPVGRPGGLGYDVTLRQALVAARAAVETEFADQPLVQAELHHTLGICFGDLGDADLAAEHMRNALTLRTARLGPEDPLTLTTATDYAVHLNFTGKHADALRLLEETLPACQRVLGTDNLDTLGCAINLAMTYDRTGRHDRAIERLEQSLDLATAKYGPRHPIVFKTMINLANSYDWAGRKSEALTFRERMAPLVESLNPDDADVLMSRHNLAYSYRQLKRYADALPIDRDTFDRRQKVFGPFHPNTLTSLWCVCADLVELGRGSEAIPLLDDSLERAVGQSLPGKIRPLADLRIEYCERHHDAAGCRRTAELWEVLNRTDGDSLYHAAVYRAMTAKVLQATDPSASGQVAAEVEAEKAVAWLRKLKATGPFDTKQIKTDPNFQPLLSRTDFEDIVGR